MKPRSASASAEARPIPVELPVTTAARIAAQPTAALRCAADGGWSAATSGGFEAWQAELHGHQVIYRTAGSGPPVLLIHGMINSSRHWRELALRLADDHTVIAPDLIGHGDSATPRGDYSIGAHAAAIRDLLAALGIRSATVVGHSLGGGVAMQFFWQFPERVERLVLISSGGLGPEREPAAAGRGDARRLDRGRARLAPAGAGGARRGSPASSSAAARSAASTSTRSSARCARCRARASGARSCRRCGR